jgi:DNA primase large subunit
MGKKLGVTDNDLRRAKMVRSFANRGEWGRVFLELGYLQQDIERVLQRESGQGGKASVRKILYAAGWLQGARYTSNLVKDNYNVKTAGILREPLLVKELKKDLDSVDLPKEGILKMISESMAELQKLVDVELRQPLPQDNVEKMAELTSRTVIECVKLAK